MFKCWCNHEFADSGHRGQFEGRYGNYFKVGHNAFEFVLDAGQVYPESDEEQLCTRIITSPAYAKALLETLRGAIEQYEERFGMIPKDGEDKPQHREQPKQHISRWPVQHDYGDLKKED